MRIRDLLPVQLPSPPRPRQRYSAALREVARHAIDAKLIAAKAAIQQIRAGGRLDRLADAEFRVFSQFGDDGIIQYLVHYLSVAPTSFVEFGVESYAESNTRFLLVNDNWRGMIMDASQDYMAGVRSDDIYWRHDLTAVAAFIDRDNINALFSEHGFAGELGILSIDIDGNDYWVWERISCVRPVIVIAEYNSVFGPQAAVSIPYDPAFYRTRAHHSNLYWGCSLAALCDLAGQKGYDFVGSNSAGNNAYFVRRDRMADLRSLSPEEGYVESRFRESRDAEGRLTFIAGPHRRAAIADMPLVDVRTGKSVLVGDLDAKSSSPVADLARVRGVSAAA
jgi:hypothetical protein